MKRCDGCAAMMIQRVLCHEHGCPRAKKARRVNKSPWTAYREGERSYFASMHQRAGTTPVKQGDAS